jgi:hypothetical protein
MHFLGKNSSKWRTSTMPMRENEIGTPPQSKCDQYKVKKVERGSNISLDWKSRAYNNRTV